MQATSSNHALSRLNRNWGPQEIAEFERLSAAAASAAGVAGYKSLARVMSALFTTQGAAWGTQGSDRFDGGRARRQRFRQRLHRPQRLRRFCKRPRASKGTKFCRARNILS